MPVWLLRIINPSFYSCCKSTALGTQQALNECYFKLKAIQIQFFKLPKLIFEMKSLLPTQGSNLKLQI